MVCFDTLLQVFILKVVSGLDPSRAEDGGASPFTQPLYHQYNLKKRVKKYRDDGTVLGLDCVV